MRQATIEATKTVYAESRKQMKELIYDKPVPNRMEMQIERKRKRQAEGGVFRARKTFLTKSGAKENAAGKKPAWKRTGNLRRSEKMKVVSPYEGIIFNEATSKSRKGKTSPYAHARHEMKNTRYPAPWRANAIRIARPKVRGIYQLAFVDAMKAGVIPKL